MKTKRKLNMRGSGTEAVKNRAAAEARFEHELGEAIDTMRAVLYCGFDVDPEMTKACQIARSALRVAQAHYDHGYLMQALHAA